MHLSWLELMNTRCYEALRFEPVEGVNVLVGSNGAGKTSILEAAAYLGLLKSFRGTPDDAIIRDGATQAVIRGEFVVESGTTRVEVELPRPGRRRVLVNGKRPQRNRDVLAQIPVVAFQPDDLDLVKRGCTIDVSAYIAAAVKAKVALIERHKMGGDCLNTGCVPSKALLRSAKLLAQARRATDFGIKSVEVDFSFRDLMQRVQRVIQTVEPHDSVERYTRLGVDCVQGEARITSPWTVEVRTPEGVRTLSTRAIVIAAGARPFVPPIPGLAEAGYLTSDTVWDLEERPQRLVVLGGGPIGCELAQAFARTGSQVTQVEMLPRLMMREDPEVSERVMRSFRDEGIDVRVETKALSCVIEAGEKVLIAERGGEQLRIPFDHILVAVGRVANTQGYGLEELGIETTQQRTVEVNAYMQTLYPNIYACGDVAGPYQFTHTAAHTAWYAAVNALFGRFRKFRADFSVIPWATFTEPEVARVGLNETDAQAQGIAYEVTTYGIDDLDRAIADEAARLGARVALQHTTAGRGKLVVSYNSLDELEGILGHIK